MDVKALILSEFEKRVFSESYVRIFKCLNLISEEELWKSPSKEIPSIGNLILHLCGNARQWILSGIGGKEDNRIRDLEFKPQKNIRKADLVFLLENVKLNMRQCLQEMPAENLERKYFIQAFHESGFSVIIHVIEHFSYHTGQITTLTKWMVHQETNYYGSMNLN